MNRAIWRISLLLFGACVFLLSSCSPAQKVESWEDYDGDRCWNCGYYSKTLYGYDNGDFVCADCIVEYDYLKCIGCGNYYDYSAGDTSRLYCCSCTDEGMAGSCCLCGAGYIDFVDMVGVELTDDLERVSVLNMDTYKEYYICVDCLEEYYKTIEPLKASFNCQHCGCLTYYTGTSYNVCNECIERFEISQCDNCGEYWEYEGNLYNGYCSCCAGDE